MTRSRLLLGVAAVLAGTAALMVVLGAVYNPVLLVAALPFAVSAGFLWLHATGRLFEVMRPPTSPGSARGSTSGDATTAGGRSPAGARSSDRVGERRTHDRHEAAARRVLGVGPDADDAAIRRAYRERVKEVHPDREDGAEAEFKRVIEAYERLSAE